MIEEDGSDLLGNADDGPLPFPHTIGAPGDGAEGDEGNQGQEVDPLEALREELRAERAAREATEARYQQQITALISRPAPQAAAPAVPEAPPDPVEKPQEFHAWNQRRTEQLVQAATNDVRQEVARENAMNTLWSKFQSAHADLAKRSTIVQAVAAVEVQNMRAQGLDPASEAIRDPDGFVEKIAARVRTELGQPAKPVKPRTGGVSGGSPGTPGKTRTTGKVTSLVDQLKQSKIDAGLI